MTEAEWLACTAPYPMLEYLDDRASDRKLMLFSVACLRRIWHLLTDDRSRLLVEATEQLVDNWGNEQVRQSFDIAYDRFSAAYQAGEVRDNAGGSTHEAVESAVHRGAGAAIQVASEAAEAVGGVAAASIPVDPPGDWSEAKTAAWVSAKKVERAAQAALLHDIIGDPFRPVRLDPAWLRPEVVALARAIYDGRTDRMPELADALEQAGFIDAAILDHCRQPGPHARGCWVLDLLLRKDESMTEAEWLVCTDPQLMWWSLRPKPSRRKQQLFAVACCRRIGHLLTDEQCRRAVEVVELLADGLVMEEEWSDAKRAVRGIACDASGREVLDKAAAAVETADCCYDPTVPAKFAADASCQPDEPAMQASLLRDILGNPFHRTQLNLSCRTPGVLQLAQSIYEESAFDLLPALGEALEGVGCHDAEILGHCRNPGPHVRGCWVVDLILGETFRPARPRGDVMTAAEWEASTDADKMLYCLHRRASSRKLRLFACACCRRVLVHMADERSRKGVEVAEWYADGLASEEELEIARTGTAEAWNAERGPDWHRYMAARAAHFACLPEGQAILLARQDARGVVRWSVVPDAASQAVEDVMTKRYYDGEGPLYYAPEREEAVASEVAEQASLLRDMFGNPFRPSPAVEPGWLSPQVVWLAQAIEGERAFDRMPELAQALEAAGCDNADLLAHCRGAGPHVRGCWAVDLLLGKE